jgi:NAD(P)-dependent dehydrogenase (short-subunit alcohol dehydrogenase family)
MYNPFSLENKTVLVTGASSGIGKATAVECAKMGANVVITGRNAERLQQTFEMLNSGNHTMIVADLQNENDRQNLVEQLPNLDGLVNCAGISGHSLFTFLKKNEIEKMFDINYFSALYLTQSIIKSKKINSNSSIVFLTSTSGIMSSYIGGSLYSSTKGALNGLIKGMVSELAPKKIRVNSVMPSMITTPIMENSPLSAEDFEKDKKLYPLKRYGTPEEVAFAVIYLLSDASSWTTGTNLLLDGGRSASY